METWVFPLTSNLTVSAEFGLYLSGNVLNIRLMAYVSWHKTLLFIKQLNTSSAHLYSAWCVVNIQNQVSCTSLKTASLYETAHRMSPVSAVQFS